MCSQEPSFSSVSARVDAVQPAVSVATADAGAAVLQQNGPEKSVVQLESASQPCSERPLTATSCALGASVLQHRHGRSVAKPAAAVEVCIQACADALVVLSRPIYSQCTQSMSANVQVAGSVRVQPTADQPLEEPERNVYDEATQGWATRHKVG